MYVRCPRIETVPPILARGVLLDVAGTKRLAPEHSITVDELDLAARAANVEIRQGDVVLVRTGYGALWSEPAEYLRGVRRLCDRFGVLLIADEVLTGFGRTGRMFACEHESVQPDIYIFAKGLTGGYLPLALTLISHEIFEPFKGSEPDSTLFYGHSYTGTALGCSAALASLEIFRSEHTLRGLPPRIHAIRLGLDAIALLSGVREVRSCGMIGAVELEGSAGLAADVCQVARGLGLLTRHIRNTVTFMPPLAASIDQLTDSLNVLNDSIQNVITRKKQLGKTAAGAL